VSEEGVTAAVVPSEERAGGLLRIEDLTVERGARPVVHAV